MDKLAQILSEWLVLLGVSENLALWITKFIFLVVFILIAFIADRLTKRVLVQTFKRFIKQTKSSWDDIMWQRGVFGRLVHIVPAIILYYAAIYIFKDSASFVAVVQSAFYIYVIALTIFVLDSMVNALHDIYNQYPFAKDRPIKGYVQVIKILLYFIGGILILSILLNKSPVYFLSGLGALTAVLLLVFKDSILGFVAGIQLSANKMVRIGDWIEMSSHNADGVVTEISLNTVKVQNWNKTISTIPTYALITNSFSNWRGMEESGGRRIKRSINIDMKSIQFSTPEMIEKFKKIKLLKDYVEKKEKELKEYNAKNDIDESVLVNGRRMTNVGTFRVYIEKYLKNHPLINLNMTFLIRHLQPTEKGLPIEIYVFSKDQEWGKYENVQADIFDHILASIGEFDLRVFQNPTGDDFRHLVK